MGALNKQFKKWVDWQVEQDSQVNLTCGIISYCEHLRKLIDEFQHLFLSAPLRPTEGREPVEIPKMFVSSIKFKREIETLNSDFTKWYDMLDAFRDGENKHIHAERERERENCNTKSFLKKRGRGMLL